MLFDRLVTKIEEEKNMSHIFHPNDMVSSIKTALESNRLL